MDFLKRAPLLLWIPVLLYASLWLSHLCAVKDITKFVEWVTDFHGIGVQTLVGMVQPQM